MHVVKTVYNEIWLEIVHITPIFLFRCLKRVGSVLSSPELDPFLIWHNALTE